MWISVGQRVAVTFRLHKCAGVIWCAIEGSVRCKERGVVQVGRALATVPGTGQWGKRSPNFELHPKERSVFQMDNINYSINRLNSLCAGMQVVHNQYKHPIHVR